MIDWLTRPLPDDKRDRHAQRRRAVHDVDQGRLYAGFAIALPDHPLAALELPRAGGREGTQRVVAIFSSSPGSLVRRRPRVRLLRRAAARARLPARTTTTSSTTPRSGASYYFSFVSLVLVAMALMFELPIFVLALVRLGVLTTERLRRNRRIGFFVVVLVAVLLPAVDPVTLVFEACRCCSCSSCRSGSARVIERALGRGAEACSSSEAKRCECTVVSADWVLPVEGAADRGRRRRVARTGASSRSGRGRARRRGALRGRRDRPGPRQRALAPRVRRLRRLRRRARLRAVARHAHRAEGADRLRRDGGDRPARRGRVPALGHHDGRRLQLLRRRGDRVRRARACARSSTSRSSAASPTARCAQFAEKRERRRRRARSSSASASRRTRRTRCSLDRLRGVRRARLPSGPTSPRARPRANGSCTAAARWRRCATCSSSRRARPASACSPARACSAAHLVAAHCVHVDAEEIDAARRRRTSPSRTARARTRCSAAAIAPLAELRAPASGGSASAPTAPPRRRRSTCSRSCARPCTSARARERRPDALLGDEALGSRRSARPARSASRTRSARSSPGKRADLAVVSLGGLAVRPWEDPAAAVVFGGSPERVLETIVDGQRRYRTRRDRMARADRRRAARAKAHARGVRAPVRERLRRHRSALLPAPAPPGEVDVRLPRARSSARLRRLRRRLRLQGGIADVLGIGADLRRRRRLGRRGARDARRRTRTTRRRSASSRPRSRRDGRPTRRSSRSSATRRCARRTRTRSRARRPLPRASASRLGAGAPGRAGRRRSCLDPGADFLPPATSPARPGARRRRRSRRPSPRTSTRRVNTRLRASCRGAYTAGEVDVLQAARHARARRTQTSSPAGATRPQNAGDAATAIAAYKQFLKLAPNDSRRRARQAADQAARGRVGADARV